MKLKVFFEYEKNWKLMKNDSWKFDSFLKFPWKFCSFENLIALNIMSIVTETNFINNVVTEKSASASKLKLKVFFFYFFSADGALSAPADYVICTLFMYFVRFQSWSPAGPITCFVMRFSQLDIATSTSFMTIKAFLCYALLVLSGNEK